MKNRKTVFRLFTVAQWEKEQAFLRKEHSKGWKLERVNFLTLYHFRRCEPEDVVYQLDFNPEGISHREEYLQMFRDCGWEYLQEYMGYSYFRKPVSRMEGRDEEIFCDGRLPPGHDEARVQGPDVSAACRASAHRGANLLSARLSFLPGSRGVLRFLCGGADSCPVRLYPVRPAVSKPLEPREKINKHM